MRDTHFDVGFRSPLARAAVTAKVIWGERSPRLICLWELREIDLFSLQGELKDGHGLTDITRHVGGCSWIHETGV
jgi:broad specificity phosphatase PhoE